MRKVRAVAIGASAAGVVVPPDVVTSVFGRIGAVVAAAGDYNSDQITNLSGVAGATVTAALNTVTAAIVAVAAVASAAAPATRTISTTAPLTGGGDLSANRTLAISAASGAAAGSMSAADFTKLAGLPSTAAPTSRAINTTAPLTGGGDLSADRTLAISDFVASGASHAKGAVPDPGAAAGTTKFLREDATWQVPAGGVPTSRAINTTAPITGGGDLSADRTLAISAASGAAAGSMSAADFSKLAAGGWPMSKFDTTHAPTLLYNFNDVLTDGSGNGNTLALALGTTRFVDFMTGYNPMRAVILGTGAGAFTATVAACRVTGDFTLEALMRVSYTEVAPASNAWFQCAGNGETSALNALWNVSSLDTTSILRARMFWENDTPSPGSNVVYDPDLVIPGPGVPFVLGVTRISDVVTFYINGVARATSGTLATAAGGGSSVVVLGCNDALALLGPMLHCASFKWIPSGLSAAQILAETKLIYGVA